MIAFDISNDQDLVSLIINYDGNNSDNIQITTNFK
jgi:hypothetical protein